MATGSRNIRSHWVNPYEQDETPAELKKRRIKEAREREREARRKEVKEKEAKRKEAKEKEKALKKQKGNSSDKHSQGQPHIPDTTDLFGIPDIPVDLNKTWAEFTGEGRKSSHKMESDSVMPNKVHVIASLIW